MNEKYTKALDYIYEDELGKLIISVEEYVADNNSRGVSQMIGRRYGNFWERLVKCTYEHSDDVELGDKVFYKDYVEKWVEDNTQDMDETSKEASKNLIMKFLEENTGNATQDLCDFTFEYDGKKYAVDTKVRFVSNDSNTVREIANSAHHLKYMGYTPVLLFRKPREDSLPTPIRRFEKEGWTIMCSDNSAEFIVESTGLDLDDWIQHNVDIWNRLTKYHEGLKKLRFDEPEWKF